MFSNLIFMTLVLGVYSGLPHYDIENVSPDVVRPLPRAISIPIVNGEPVRVNISMHILFFNVDSETQEFHLIMFFRKEWRDPRLAFESNDTWAYKLLYDEDAIWTPDLFFLNEVVDKQHVVIKPSGFIRVFPDGKVFTSQRVNLKASCPMNLTIYPFDTQICRLNIESYIYTDDQIVLDWNKTDVSPITGDLTNKEFDVHYNWETSTIGFHGYNFARTTLNLNLKRIPTAIVWRILIPTTMIVGFSWVSFLLDRKEVFIRMTLCLAPIITYFLQLNFGKCYFLHPGYPTGLDIWSIFSCFLLFGSFLETIFVIRLIGKFYPGADDPNNLLYKKFDARCRNLFALGFSLFNVFCIVYIYKARDF